MIENFQPDRAMPEQKRLEGAIAKQSSDPWVHRSAGMKPTMGGYPVVYMTDWCGDHRLDENKI
jgi:hypothetical protein